MQFNEHQKGLPSPTRVTYIHQVSESCLYKTRPRDWTPGLLENKEYCCWTQSGECFDQCNYCDNASLEYLFEDTLEKHSQQGQIKM